MTEPAYDLLIRGGRVATVSDVLEADVAISGGAIVAAGCRVLGARSTRRASWFCRVVSTTTPISSSFRPQAS